MVVTSGGVGGRQGDTGQKAKFQLGRVSSKKLLYNMVTIVSNNELYT